MEAKVEAAEGMLEECEFGDLVTLLAAQFQRAPKGWQEHCQQQAAALGETQDVQQAAAPLAPPAPPATAEQQPTAASAAAAPAAANGVTLSREQLVRFYEKHDPTKVASVDKILGHYSAAELVESLTKRYGASPTDPEGAAPSAAEDAPAAQGDGGEVAAGAAGTTVTREALVRFYEKHDPTKVASVDKILGHYSAAELVESLTKRYGFAPQLAAPSAGERHSGFTVTH
jgi:hypothetical protein